MPSPLARMRAIVGLLTLGEGLFISLRVVPHESLLLGLALVAAGALLLWRAPLPRVARLPRAPIAAAGLLVAAGLVCYQSLGHTWDAPKVAILALALGAVGAAGSVLVAVLRRK